MEGLTPDGSDPLGAAEQKAIEMLKTGASPSQAAEPSSSAPGEGGSPPPAAPAPAGPAARRPVSDGVSVPADSPLADLLNELDQLAAENPSEPAPENGGATPKTIGGTPYTSPEKLAEGYKEAVAWATKLNQKVKELESRAGTTDSVEKTAAAIGKQIAEVLASKETAASRAEQDRRLQELKDTDPDAYNREIMAMTNEENRRQIEDLKNQISKLTQEINTSREVTTVERAAADVGVPPDFFAVMAATTRFRNMSVSEASPLIKAVYDEAVEAGVAKRISSMAAGTPQGARPTAPRGRIPAPLPSGGSFVTRKVGVKEIGVPGERSFERTEKLMKDLIRQNFTPASY